jgi:hypothetical protein
MEEAVLAATGNNCLRNSTDANVLKGISAVNKAQDDVKPVNTSTSWRPKVVEFKAMCFVLYPDDPLPVLMTMVKAWQFLYYQAHRSLRPGGRKKKIDDIKPKGNDKQACKFFVEQSTIIICGTVHLFLLWNSPPIVFVEQSTDFFCGTVHIYFLWNSPHLFFVEQSTVLFVEQSISIHFFLWNRPVTLTHYTCLNVVPCIGIRDPHADEVTKDWTFLKNNFDHDDYKLIVEKGVIGKNLISAETFKQYVNAIVDLHRHQRDVLGLTDPCLLPGMIRKNTDVKKLVEMVTARKLRLMRETFAERLDAGALPFDVLHKLPQIEEAMWERNSHGGPYAVSGLRDRFFLLFTKAGLVRGESLCHAELSDLFHIVKPDEGPSGHDALIFVLQIHRGKQNKNGNVVWGRSMRHADVSLCSIGALAFYLVMRFFVTGETIDITDNKSWFNRKLLVRPHKNADLNAEMSYTHYGKVLDAIGKLLDIIIAKFKHFGRLYGQMDGELKDMETADLDAVGNWALDNRKKHYSLKIPFRGLRVLAGHPSTCGCAYWARGVCDMSDLMENGKPLEEMIFPFLEKMKADLKATRELNVEHTTAAGFIGLLTQLRVVFLQDAAVMVLQGRKHAVLDLPFAKTRAFGKLLKRMDFTLKEEMDKKVHGPSVSEAISEELGAHLSNFHHTLSHGLGEVKNSMKEVNATTTTNFRTVKGAIDGLVNKEDMKAISSAMYTVMDKRSRSPVPLRPSKKRATLKMLAPMEHVDPEAVGVSTAKDHIETTIAAVEIAAISPTFLAHIPRQMDHASKHVGALTLRPAFLSDDYDGAVDQLWESWYSDGIDVIVENKADSENWRKQWTTKDNKKFSRMKYIILFIQKHAKDKPVGLIIQELKELQGKKKLSTLETKIKEQIKLAKQA